MAGRKSSTASKKAASSKSSGLGDTVEKVTKATGIKAAVDWFSEKTGVDCGCEARKEKLNALFRYRKPKCLTKDEYDWLKDNLAQRSWTAQVKNRITEIHARVFDIKLKYTGCASCIRTKVQELKAIMSTYENQ